MQFNKRLATVAITLCLTGATGCADEIHVYESSEPVAEQASLLVGSWEWPVEVSHLEVDADLHAIQTGDFDSPGASPSSYTLTPMSDSTLALEGWLANAPCEVGFACDEGRAFQRHHMSYHVDEAQFIPFALLRKSGVPGSVGGPGAGLFEGFGMEETRLAEQTPAGDDVFRVIETRWRLNLGADGGWFSTMERIAGDGDGTPFEETVEQGTWSLAADGTLTLHPTDGGEGHRTIWKGDVVALQGLVFNRLD